jgi:hypothetical protein
VELPRKRADPTSKSRVEQAIILRIDAWNIRNINWPQHIPRLLPAQDVERTIGTLQRLVEHLEAVLQNAGIPISTA